MSEKEIKQLDKDQRKKQAELELLIGDVEPKSNERKTSHD